MTEERGLSFGKTQSAPTAAEFANNRAYVIGVNSYSNGIRPLRTAVADAERLGQLLAESHGYIVRSFPRDGAPSLAAIRELLHETLPQEVGPKDRVLFYFAGHGIALDGDDGPEGFLVPEDANREDRDSFLAMTELHDALASLPCRHLLLILDCCFAGAFRWSSTRDLSALPSVIHRERYERYIQDPAWQVLTSAAYDQTALDVLSGNTIGERIETAEHSPFAAALFRALEGDADLIPRGKDGQPGGDGVITATELYLYLRECVETATVERRMRQTPGLWPLRKHDKGEYILLSPGHELNLPPAPELNYANNPYRGLQSFEEEHRQLFFGRTRIVDQLHGLVASHALTVVLGASGTGKSSVVKAGLLPHLRGMDNEDWQILPVIRPGKSPLATLASLALPGEDNALGEAERQSELRLDENAFAERVKVWADSHSLGSRLLLMVDQLEELITLCWDEWERKHFIESLAAALNALPDRFRLILTLRSDFEPQFADCPLKSGWKASRYVVPPMTTDELREAIEGPASVRVLYFQPAELVDRLIDEVIQTPGAMPLLSFTLSELYVRYLERRGDDRCLTAEDYERLGGVVGSLRSRASELYDKLDGVHQATMKRIMLRMVSAQGGELARRRVPKSELVFSKQDENASVAAILQRLSESRLIVEGKEADGEPFVEPAHDALVCSWDKLLQWTRSEQEELTLRRLLTPAANDWQAHEGGTWHTNPRLTLLKRVHDSEANWLNATESNFVRRSLTKRKTILLGAASFVSFAFLALLGLTLYAFSERDRANERTIAAVQETANLQTADGLRAQDRGQSFLAMQHYARAIAKRAEIDQYDETNRIRLGILMREQPAIHAVLRHTAIPDKVIFSNDARRLLALSDNGDCMLWDVESGTLIKDLRKDGENVEHVSFSPDSRWLVMAREWDNLAYVYDAGDGRVTATLKGHGDYLFHVEFSPDSQNLLTASADGTARIWNVKTGASIQELGGHEGFVRHAAISPDGAVLATCSDDGVRVWKPGKEEPVFHVDAEDRTLGIETLTFSADGRFVMTDTPSSFSSFPDQEEFKVYLWDVVEGSLHATFKNTSAARFTPRPNRVLVTPASGLLSTAESRVEIRDPSMEEAIAAMAGYVTDVSDDGQWCAVIRNRQDVSIYDLEDGELVESIRGSFTIAKFLPDGRHLITDSDDNSARIWMIPSGKLVGSIQGHSARLSDVGIALGGLRIATGSGDQHIRVWTRQLQPFPRLAGDGGRIVAARFEEHDDSVITASYENWAETHDDNRVELFTKNRRYDNALQKWDMLSGRLLATMRPEGEVMTVEFDVEHQRAYAEAQVNVSSESGITNDYDRSVWVYDAATGELLKTMQDQTLGAVNARRGRFFTRKEDGKTGYMFDAETLQAEYEIQEENYLNECSFSADGTRLLVVTGPSLSKKPRSFHVYDAKSGREIVSVDFGTTYEPDESAISADGSLVAILHTITTADVYRVADGRRLGSFEIPSFETEDGMHRGSATDAFAINPNGSQIMSSGNQTTLWNSPDFEKFFRLHGRFRAFDGSGDRVLTSKDNQVLLWDCANGRLRATLQGNSEPVTLASFSQDGHRTVTSAQGGSAWVWDTETGSLITELAGHVYKNTACGFTTDNRLSVTASHDGTAQVWDIAPVLTEADLLTPIVEILTGTTIGGNGELQSLPVEDLVQRRMDVAGQMEEAMQKTQDTARLELAGLILRVDPRNEPALEVIVSTLSNPNSRDRFAAARALQNLGPGGQNAVEKLEPLFRDGDSLAASAAGMALFRMHGRSTGVLIDGLKAERQVTSRLAAHFVKLSGILAKDAIPDLIESLGSGDAQVARDVSQALSRMGPAPIPALNVALEQPNESIRRRAAIVLELLGQVGDASIPSLVEALGAPDRSTRVQAGESLIEIGEEAVGPVTSALRHEQWLVRSNAAFVLGELETKSPETTKALIRGMLTDDDERVRAKCLGALKDIYLFGGNNLAIPQLVDRFESEPDGDVRDRIVAAVISLGRSEDVAKLGAEAVPFLVKEIEWSPPEGEQLDEEDIDGVVYPSYGADVERRQDAASALEALGSDAVDAVPAMIESLLDEQNWQIRDAIIAVGEPAFPRLVEALSDKRPLIRAAVVEFFDADEFSELAPTAIPSLLQNLKDESGLVRVATAEVLLSLRQEPQTLVPVLHEQLKQSSSAARRKKSAELLAKIGRPADVTLPTLEKLFEDPDDAVRFASAEAWIAIRNDIELEVDAVMLYFSLARAIEELIDDGKRAVIIHPQIVPLISEILRKEQNDSLRMNVVTLVGGFGAQAEPWIPSLIQCALSDYDSDREDFNPNLRSSAAESLAKIGAVEALVEILSDHESESDNKRDDAASALIEDAMLHDRAVPLVAKLLTHSHEGVRESAVEVLGSIGAASAPALPALERAKDDEVPDVRIAAAQAIETIREAMHE